MNHNPYNPPLRPRYIPSSARLRIVLGGFMNQFGWFFFGFGLIFVWIFGLQADYSSLYHFRGPVRTVDGTVTEIVKTKLSEGGSRSGSGGTPVYAYHYEFDLEGTVFSGVSYVGGKRCSSGDRVTVEYPVGKPKINRIEGMRRALLPWMVGFVFLFPIVGLIFIISGLKKGLRANRLLTFGRLGMGTLVAKEPTRTRINRRTVYKLTFEFEAHTGRRYQVSARTHLPETLEDEELEQLLYDPAQPESAVMLNSLPGAPALDPSGNVYFKEVTMPALLVLLIPAATVIGHSYYIYKKFFS